MDKYMEKKILNHKKLNKKILSLTYKDSAFELEDAQRKELVGGYIEEIVKHKNLVVIFDFRNIEKWSKRSIWEGASDLKKHEEVALKHVDRTFVITSNSMLNSLIGVVLKIIKNKIKTTCHDNLKTALEEMEK